MIGIQRLIHKVDQEVNRVNKRFSLITIDIDFFLRYCLRFDPATCKKIMQNITIYLVNEFEGHQIYYREGCDEFFIILGGYDNQQTYLLVTDLLRKFRKQRFLTFLGEEYSSLRMTFSAGISSYPQNGEREFIVRKSIVALFRAKSLRRNNIQCYAEMLCDTKDRKLYDRFVQITSLNKSWGQIGRVTKITGVKDFRMWEPQAIASTQEGTLYIADQNNHQILCMKDGRLWPIVGDGVYGCVRHRMNANKARLNKPTGLFACHDRVYITDTGNDSVLMVEVEKNVISVICGQQGTGYEGDGGLAKDAKLNKPGGVVIDKNQNIYINDIANNVIRKIDCYGRISTFAGNGKFEYAGDGGYAQNCSFHEIYGIAIDYEGENIFVADYYNHRIRKINVQTQRITTVAGCGNAAYSGDGGDPLSAGLNRPVAVCSDRQGNLYIAESGNQSIRIVVRKENKIYTLAGGCGTGTGLVNNAATYQFANPNSLTVVQDDLYVLDGANSRICKIDLRGVLI